MNNSDIREGAKVVNIHNGPTPGHTLIIARVLGSDDDSAVILEMRGPNGVATLERDRKLLRDHYRLE